MISIIFWVLGAFVYLGVGLCIITQVVRIWARLDPSSFDFGGRKYKRDEYAFFFFMGVVLWPLALALLLLQAIYLLCRRLAHHFSHKALQR